MTATDITLDTNILFYAFDPADPKKHSVAKKVLAACYDRSAPLTLQCLSEFYRAATKKQLVPPGKAAAIISDLRKGMSIIPAAEADLVSAMRLHQQHGFQFFDCLIVATAARNGCLTLFSEDFQHKQAISNLTILNPFQMNETDLTALLN